MRVQPFTSPIRFAAGPSQPIREPHEKSLEAKRIRMDRYLQSKGIDPYGPDGFKSDTASRGFLQLTIFNAAHRDQIIKALKEKYPEMSEQTPIFEGSWVNIVLADEF